MADDNAMHKSIVVLLPIISARGTRCPDTCYQRSTTNMRGFISPEQVAGSGSMP
jgi:hypothetical protein